MTALDELRAALDAARGAQDAAVAAQVAADAQVRQTQAALAAAQRQGDGVGAATEAAARAQHGLDLAHTNVAAAAQQVVGVLKDSLDLTDPRVLVDGLSADVPTLLFPVRLELRFHNDGDAHQLWVRVFPDTCSIDTFSAEPTTGEVADARTYWGQVWQAGGDLDGERAAWRALVAGHGSGRSAWLVGGVAGAYAPSNPGDRPTRTSPEEVILALVVPVALSAADQAAVSAFWTAWWRADTDATARNAAHTTLVAALGVDGAAAVEAQPPVGIDAPPVEPATRASAPVTLAFAVLPDVAAVPNGWNRAPRAALLPDRFVLVLETGPESDASRTEVLGLPVPPTVFTGPDPLAPADQQLRPDNGQLILPDQLAWLADFDRAVADGLGFRVDLSPQQAAGGFDRVYVVGLRGLESPADSATGLATLLAHHSAGRAGLALVAQGTPTNNLEGADAGYRRTDDADASFDALQAGPPAPQSDPRLKADGQWLTDLLGIDPAALTAVPGVHGLDQRDARAMQTLLWPATMGYLLGTLLDPLLGDPTVEAARQFFLRYVRGRGELPAVRIGTQPYGLLATTAFSRVSWLRQQSDRDPFLSRLWALLQVAEQEWAAALPQVPSLGTGGAPVTDGHATLLGVLGLHPASAEFHYRYGESLDQLVNQANLSGFGELLYRVIEAASLDVPAVDLLARLGDTAVRPPLLDLYFLGRQAALAGPLVDDRPTSETTGIRVWTTDNRNYLQWLRDAAATSLDALRADVGFAAAAPTALLFLLVQHALTLGYAEGGRELFARAGYTDDVVLALRREPPFVHVAPEGVSESRYEPLFRHDPLISPGTDWTVGAEVAHLLTTPEATAVLADQLAALDLLADASTARLERALVEHVDTVGYRLDAWLLGFVNLQLEHMRSAGAAEQGGTGGLHLGAYGFLENVRPKPKPLVPVQLPPDLATIFGTEPPLMADPSNGGHLLAPSLNQAVTASVLRSAYLANADSTAPDALAVNLSSQRVRAALEVIEGVRQGQTMSALLGYGLERGLHDRSGFAEVDVFIYALRRKFPLAADQLASTATDPSTPIEAVQARDVVDGLALVDHLESTHAYTYPFGLTPDEIPPATAAQQTALAAEMDRLRDVRDAIGDVALAEAVHHASQGGAARSGATLAAYQDGRLPPEVEVVRTPTTGVTLTHRVGVHLDAAAVPPPGATPRAVASPAVDAWLAGLLPPLADIACVVSWADPVVGTPRSATVTLNTLGLRPIDLLDLLSGQDQAMTELDDRIVRRVLAAAAPRPDALLHLSYRDGNGHLAVFEVASLATHVRALLTAARPLRASDVVTPGEASHDLDAPARLDRTALLTVQTTLTDLASDSVAYLATWDTLLADTTAHHDAIVAGTDTAIDDAVELLARGASLGVAGSGWGQAISSRQAQYAGTVSRLRDRAETWRLRLVDIDAQLTAYDLLPAATPAADRLAALARIEALITPANGVPDPDPVVQRATVGGLRDLLASRRTAVLSVANGGAPGLVSLLTAVQTLVFADVDSAPFPLDTTETSMVTVVQDVAASVRSLSGELGRRGPAAQAAFDDETTAADGPGKLDALQRCGQALLGEAIRLVPTFTMPTANATEWTQALAGQAALLSHLTGVLQADFPVDDWLHSASRVRASLGHLEQAGLVAQALGRPEHDLEPIQLPYRPTAHWLAMDYPDDEDLSGEHLLYTACYPAGFTPAGDLIGLMVDEWTEVLPSGKATAGLAFNFDQPSSEAPQALLLVTPASGGTTWVWDDLRQAVPDTVRLAKLRAVEPVQLDQGATARFLPATVSAFTERGISIGLALAINNGVALAVQHD
ncbi:hypothetical protein acdb102_30910 [Acidothermaceae bacterium B102]|nr:hypothetical protein acdb102_30910 [Acidothermaceae bacterium B102]